MPQKQMINRLRHPDILVFLLGGVLGLSVNMAASVLLYRYARINPLVSFFIGTVLNEAFHHVYYKVVYVNEEVRFKTPLGLHLLMYLVVALAGAGVLAVFLGPLQWPFETSVLAVIVLLSLANSLIIRVSTFSSAKLAEVEYCDMNESYYDDMTDETKVSKFRAWYHRSRYLKLTRFVMSHYKPGMKVADLGCGNCHWNTEHVPVIGVDINEKMLKWAKNNGRLRDYKVSGDLAKTGLPIHSQDIVIISEVLEHLVEHKPVLEEVKRILKPGGTFLVTVPYDFFLGPFFILYNINCLYMGYVRGSVYHKYRCGHINHFTKGRLRNVLEKNGLTLNELHVVNGLLLYGAAQQTKG
jgi:ubiquinone/menaquinone biosynthesis C-methylase UbiE